LSDPQKTITRRNALRGAVRVAVLAVGGGTFSSLFGCGGSSDNNSGGTNVTPTSASSLPLQPTPTGAITNASLTISGTSAGTMPDRFVGLSYEKGDFATERLFNGGNNALAAMFQLLGNGVLRIGGNSVDKTLWTAAGLGMTSGQVAPADVTALAAFIKLTSWKVLYAVNLATSTPQLAAAEVAFVQSALGSALLGFEIGNEPDLYGSTYFTTGWNLSAFEARWSSFRTAILAQTPSAVITGPASASSPTTWTAPFAQYATSQQISLLTQHYYRANGQLATSTAALLITPDTQLPKTAQPVQAAAQAIGVPWRMAETNSYYNGGASGASDTFASALWAIDHLFTIALNGGSGVNMHGGNNGPYTPIQTSGATVIGAKPEFYGLLMVAMTGQGTLLQTSLSVGGLNVTAYAVQNSPGALSLLIVNKDSTQNLNLTTTLNSAHATVKILTLAGTGLTATTGQTLGGASISNNGSLGATTAYAPASLIGTTLNCYVPALTAVLIQLG
jgi:hypothetical protein